MHLLYFCLCLNLSINILSYMKHLKKHILVILCALQVQYSLALNLQKDWLIDGSSYQAKVTTTDKELCLSNGLLSRTFILSPNVATIAFDNLMNGNAELRAIRPEAVLTINGMEYPVGGLYKQPVQNFLVRPREPAFRLHVRAQAHGKGGHRFLCQAGGPACQQA